MTPRTGAALLLAMAVALGGCDSGPSGPGTLRGTLEPAPETSVGAAVLAIQGDGVEGISADGTTRVFAAGPDGSGHFRALLVSTGSAEEPLRFRVDVRDLGAPPPAVTIVELADLRNDPLPSNGGARVRFHR